jgi:hypothetical protein
MVAQVLQSAVKYWRSLGKWVTKVESTIWMHKQPYRRSLSVKGFSLHPQTISRAAHRLASLLQEYRGAWPPIKSDAKVDPERGQALAAALAKRREFFGPGADLGPRKFRSKPCEARRSIHGLLARGDSGLGSFPDEAFNQAIGEPLVIGWPGERRTVVLPDPSRRMSTPAPLANGRRSRSGV